MKNYFVSFCVLKKGKKAKSGDIAVFEVISLPLAFSTLLRISFKSSPTFNYIRVPSGLGPLLYIIAPPICLGSKAKKPNISTHNYRWQIKIIDFYMGFPGSFKIKYRNFKLIQAIIDAFHRLTSLG